MSRAMPAVLLAAATLAAGCGGAPPADEVARQYVASDDPGKCDDAALSLLERETRRRGEAARAACRQAVARSEPPTGVRVTSRMVSGRRARIGLEASGQDVIVRLERRDDRWLVAGFGN